MIRPLAVLVCALCVLLPGAASAKPKLVLTAIEGDTSGDVFAAVVEAVAGDELTVISGKDVNRAVTKLGDAADFAEPELKKLAEALEADAIMLGKLDKTVTPKTLKFRLYIHDKMAKGFTVSFKDPRSPKFRTLLHDKVVEKLTTEEGDADPEPSGKKPDDPAPGAKPGPKIESTKPGGEAGKPKPETAGARKPGPKVASVERGTSVDAGSSTVVERPRSANLIPLRFDLGISLTNRSFGFDSTMAGNPRDISLGTGVGPRIAAELYPLALSNPRGGLARFGVAFDYERTFNEEVVSTGENASVAQSGFSFGLRYRWAFGTTERSPTLTFGVGYSRRNFAPDLAKLTMDAAKADVAKSAPTSELAIIDPGVAFRYPVTPRFALCAGLRALLIVDAGPILKNTSYGQGSSYGIDADLGLDIVLGPHLAVRLGGELTQVSYSFTGNGMLSNLDADPSTREVNGLTDRSIGGSVTLGVLY